MFTSRSSISESLKKLIDQGHEVFIVTATKYQSVKCKMEKILFSAGHNRKFDAASIGAVRVENWDQTIAFVF